jgi:hypothetical protein
MANLAFLGNQPPARFLQEFSGEIINVRKLTLKNESTRLERGDLLEFGLSSNGRTVKVLLMSQNLIGISVDGTELEVGKDVDLDMLTGKSITSTKEGISVETLAGAPV